MRGRGGRGPKKGGGGKRSGHAAAGGRRGGLDRRDARDGDEARKMGDGAPPGWLKGAVQESERRIAGWLKSGDDLKAARARPEPNAKLTLDPWQQEVLDALLAGKSVIVDAPTTAGKTRAVEAFFHTLIAQPTFRACYTTPVKSLSNDKLREFRVMFGAENVGIATGDVKENLGAPIVVATLESYRNSLLGVEPDLGRTLAVFDEYHYMQDESRGSAWEEAIILTPGRCQILMLSASVANAEEFASWLSSLGEGRDAVLVRTETRPVPLVPLVYVHGHWLSPETVQGSVLKHLDRERMANPLRQEELVRRLIALLPLGLTPSIIYCGRRLQCETLAALLAKSLPPLDAKDSEEIGKSLAQSHAETGALSFINSRLRQLLQTYGVGYHHSGLAAPARMAVEALVKRGLLRYCSATMGLSLGINFSVRSALISDYQRPGELGFSDYAPSEVLQMLGRAGRRGRDAVGFSLWPNAESFARLGNPRREGVRSRLRNDPTTFLGLVGRGFSLRAIENFYSKSFLRFQDRRVDLSVVTKSRWQRELGHEDLPCHSPAAEAARFFAEKVETTCRECKYRGPCHALFARRIRKDRSSLAALHMHLHAIAALDHDESLTSFGKIARYFPQAGGLVLSRMIADGEITAARLTEAAELAAAMGLARHKEPGMGSGYRFPFDARAVEERLTEAYPEVLFTELYDQPYGRRTYTQLREWNPPAGFLVREWITGTPWKELTHAVCSEQFGVGDAMSLLYRVATYLQSMVQAELPEFRDAAKSLRLVILREPLDFALNI